MQAFRRYWLTMHGENHAAPPAPAFAGGTGAITTTPVVGSPSREYPEVFTPGAEALEEGELRVTVLGSGNPWVTRAQASGSILVEVGNPERDLLIFDLGSGSLANFAALKLPVNALDKVFITHLHADHTADLITLFGSYRKSGRVDRGVRVWGPSGSEPRFGTKHFVDGTARPVSGTPSRRDRSTPRRASTSPWKSSTSSGRRWSTTRTASRSPPSRWSTRSPAPWGIGSTSAG
jgi:ribonuclease Z